VEQKLILDRYRPLEDLGEGAYGTVVLAYDTRMQRRVAIKRLPFPKDRSGRPVSPAGLAEARTAALLNHPNIVTVHEWDSDADEAFIIMEHVDGISMADLPEVSGGPLTPDEAAAIIESVAAALTFAHDNGVLHLDIKPENVLVSRSGEIKVTDFGIAAISSAAGHGYGAGGTLGHMPIEQLRGERLDERTDVWALAVLAYQSLADANPFFAETYEGTVFKAEIVEPPPPSEFVDDLPGEIDDVLLTALAPDPSDRHPDVRSLADSLLPYLGDPAAGCRSLAALVEEAFGDGSEEDASFEDLGLWDRLMPHRRAGVGVASALVATWLTWVGLAPFGLPLFAVVGAAALAALAAGLAPPLGLAVAVIILFAGMTQVFPAPHVGVLFVAAAIVWWTVGRRSSGLLAGLCAPALGVAYLAPAAPVLAGFALRPVRAAVLSAFGAALTMYVSMASSSTAPHIDVPVRFLPTEKAYSASRAGDLAIGGAPWSQALVFQDLIGPLVVIAAWALAAALMSLSCGRATRNSALLGAVLGFAILLAGYSLADMLVTPAYNDSVTWFGPVLLSRLAASSILVVLVIAAGPPIRAEEE